MNIADLEKVSPSQNIGPINSILATLNISAEVCPKLLISQSKFSGLRKFTLRYHSLR